LALTALGWHPMPRPVLQLTLLTLLQTLMMRPLQLLQRRALPDAV
jgi:hypothetical protein